MRQAYDMNQCDQQSGQFANKLTGNFCILTEKAIWNYATIQSNVNDVGWVTTIFLTSINVHYGTPVLLTLIS